jgi:flagellar assembly factor FliW
MIIQSSRFGTIDVKEERIITFKDGLLGFPDAKKFIVADDPLDVSLPFKWLICVDQPELAFLVTDPGIFFKDYVFDLTEDDRTKIGAQSEDDVSVIALLTVPADPKKITANLRGPLVINWKTLVGRQVILKGTHYTTKHYIFIQSDDSMKNETAESSLVSVSAEVAATSASEKSSIGTSHRTH